MLNQYAQVGAVDAKTVTLTFSKAAIGKQFEARSDFFRDALREVAGLDLAVRVTSEDEPAKTSSESPAATAVAPSDPDVVDLTHDDDDGDDGDPPPPSTGPADALALLESELSAQVIDRIDGT
jgi:hypothetical protein